MFAATLPRNARLSSTGHMRFPDTSDGSFARFSRNDHLIQYPDAPKVDALKK
jgi:hypothetical protein